MRATILAVSGILAFGSIAYADPPVTTVSVECNWGTLTMEQIQGGFEHGPHSADPGNNGVGPDDPDQPRAGLANVLERGNLQETCEFIESLL